MIIKPGSGHAAARYTPCRRGGTARRQAGAWGVVGEPDDARCSYEIQDQTQLRGRERRPIRRRRTCAVRRRSVVEWTESRFWLEPTEDPGLSGKRRVTGTDRKRALPELDRAEGIGMMVRRPLDRCFVEMSGFRLRDDSR